MAETRPPALQPEPKVSAVKHTSCVYTHLLRQCRNKSAGQHAAKGVCVFGGVGVPAQERLLAGLERRMHKRRLRRCPGLHTLEGFPERGGVPARFYPPGPHPAPISSRVCNGDPRRSRKTGMLQRTGGGSLFSSKQDQPAETSPADEVLRGSCSAHRGHQKGGCYDHLYIFYILI